MGLGTCNDQQCPFGGNECLGVCQREGGSPGAAEQLIAVKKSQSSQFESSKGEEKSQASDLAQAAEIFLELGSLYG